MCPKNMLPDHRELSELSHYVAQLGRLSSLTAEFKAGMPLEHRLNLEWVKNWIIEYTSEDRIVCAIDCIIASLGGPLERRDIDEIQDAIPDLAMLVYLIQEADLWVEMMRQRESGVVTTLSRWRRWNGFWGGK